MTRLLGLVGMVFILSQNAYGWDTNIKAPYQGWLSIYNANGKTLQQEARAEDEHTALSDWALRALGAERYSYNRDPVIVTDLNASYFRKALLGRKGSFLHGPYRPEEGELEKRQLPAPSQFSGLPDYSYTLYDWINKNLFCPPKAGLEGCHRFEAWMGILNANHFGTQAKESYWHLHRLAINLANHARSLRETFLKDRNALAAYGEYVREAEREALAVEGYAQHFLQDRWSMGHMWERWNAPDYNQLTDRNFENNLMVAAFAGLLHGAEGSLGMPDALSSPQVSWKQMAANQAGKLVPKAVGTAAGAAVGMVVPGVGPLLAPKAAERVTGLVSNEIRARQFENGFVIPRWKQHGDKDQRGNSFAGFPGVGDFRFLDMLDGKFGKEYTSVGRDYPLEVGAQKSMMQQCLMAGWAEVIRAFGQNPGGGFGSEGVTLRDDIRGFSSLKFRCDDQWATNASMALGWFDNMAAAARNFTFGYYARLIVTYKSKGLNQLRKAATDRLNIGRHYNQRRALLRITWRIMMFGQKLKGYENHTTLARATRGMDFGFARTGNHYHLPDYIEPASIDHLPDGVGGTGKDKMSWFGFFNRSHADYWCGPKGVDLLRELRGSDDSGKQAVCEYLADRFYEGTDPMYKGMFQEKRTTDHTKNGSPLHGVCHYVGGREPRSPDKLDGAPVFLRAGYVSDPYARPDQTSNGYQTVRNWCARVPVLHYVRDENGEIRDEVVAKIRSWDDPVVLKGENLGNERGKLWLDCQQFGAVRVPDDHIKVWTDSRIEMDLAWLPEDRRKDNTHSICVETSAGKQSVGHFYVRRESPGTIVSGRVVTGASKPVADAEVLVEIGDGRYAGRSKADGMYHIDIPADVEVPATLIVTANREGYNTGSTVVKKESFRHADIILARVSKDVIQIDPSLHHLGDSHYGGTINSRFQKRKAEGVSWTRAFEVPVERFAALGGQQAELTLTAKGLQEQNPVLLNGRKIGVLSSSNPDGSATMVRVPVDPCSLHGGVNELTIKSADSDANGDLDDFEFANVQLVFRTNKDISPYDKRFATLSTVRPMEPDSGAVIKTVDAGGRFVIEGRGKGACSRLRDVAAAAVYRASKGEDSAITIRLRETDLDSGVFRSSEPVSVRALGARPGEKIVIRSGVRGTLLLVTKPKDKRKAEANRELEQARERWKSLRMQWKQLSDLIDEQRASGKNVDDLMANLRRIADEVQRARARVVELEKKLGVSRGRIETR